MIRLFATAIALLLALPVLAAPGDVRRFPAQGNATAQLRIHGTTDIEVFAVVIADYQRLHPGTEVVYEDIITQDLPSWSTMAMRCRTARRRPLRFRRGRSGATRRSGSATNRW
ncbi:hypothetical protein G6F46_015083 [Rhizopus delemar]|nr:hypothetical protein G6F46_015083 [Rhizopus delemar]